MAEYAHPWYPVQFRIDLRCSVPESWHTLFWWLDHFLFSPCQDPLVLTPFLLTQWLLLSVSSLVWLHVYTSVGETQIADANMELLFVCVTYGAHLYVLFICTHMGRKARQPVQIYPSVSLDCLSLYFSICFFYIFVYVVGTLPKTACGCMHMHMAAAIVEVPVCTLSYLKRCCCKVPSQEKRTGKLALFYF